MFTLTRWMMAPVLLTGWLVFAGPASAQKTPVTVQDDAGFFSPDAIAKANREIARIKNQFKKDLVIETVKESPSRPDDVSKDPKSESYKKFFDNWAVQRAKNHHINGVGVFLLKNPEILRVVEDSNTQGRLFTHEDGNELRSRMIAKLKAKDFDGALIAAVSFVNDTMARHQQAAAPANPNTPAKTNPAAPAPQQAEIPWLKYILIGLAVLFVLWIVMAVIRGLSGAGGGGGGGYAPGYGGGGGGGGGFMNGFLGGLFGAAAGMWMYNSFFGGHSSSAWGSSPNSGPTGGTDPADPGAGADYGVSGGEYGADAGGKPDPDWGAGGGGDAGDAGGGGGDWGGGGGGGDWGGGGGGGDFGGGGGGGDW